MKEVSKEVQNNFLKSIKDLPDLHLVFKNKSLVKNFDVNNIATSENSLIVKKGGKIEQLQNFSRRSLVGARLLINATSIKYKSVKKKSIRYVCCTRRKIFSIAKQNGRPNNC